MSQPAEGIPKNIADALAYAMVSSARDMSKRSVIMSKVDYDRLIGQADVRFVALQLALKTEDKSPFVAVCTAQRLEGYLTAEEYTAQLELYDKLKGRLYP
jgi:hypothetical protein